MPPLDPAWERALAVAGWSSTVILWHTTIVALALGAWRAWRRAAPAGAQYRAAVLALAACVLLTAITPMALLSASPTPAAVASRLAPPTPGGPASPVASVAAAFAIADGPRAGRVATAAGVLWALGSLAGLVRLAGGWLLARRIRRRATPVPSGALAEAAAGVSAAWQLPAAALLTSAHVEAPVVLGHREPAILLPFDATTHLDAAAIAPLIAHELAHVARRDYAANVAQSLVEALLFFSPGVHWISRRVREAREYCCDDLVVARCGPRPYVEALTSLAGLGVAARARPVLNVAGPRLIVRVRRLLQEDAMIPFARIRITGSIAALAVAAVAGIGMVPLAARQVASTPTASAASGRIPLGFVTRQPGSSVTLRSVAESEAGLCGTTVVHNDADRAVTQLQFVGVLTATGEEPSGMLMLSQPLEVHIEPGEEATLSPNLIPASEARWRMARNRVQVMCALVDVQFDNGYGWRITPNPAARTAEEMLGLPRPEIPRALMGTPGENHNLCLDEAGRESSQGAIVAIRNEPGRFARCVGGAWVDYVLPGAPPAGP